MCAPHLLPEVKEVCPQGCRRRTSRSFQVSVLVEMRGPGDMLLEEHGGFLRGGGGVWIDVDALFMPSARLPGPPGLLC